MTGWLVGGGGGVGDNREEKPGLCVGWLGALRTSYRRTAWLQDRTLYRRLARVRHAAQCSRREGCYGVGSASAPTLFHVTCSMRAVAYNGGNRRNTQPHISKYRHRREMNIPSAFLYSILRIHSLLPIIFLIPALFNFIFEFATTNNAE